MTPTQTILKHSESAPCSVLRKLCGYSIERKNTMGRTKTKFDYLIEYKKDIEWLQDGLSLRRVRSKTGRAINTLRKLKRIFHI